MESLLDSNSARSWSSLSRAKRYFAHPHLTHDDDRIPPQRGLVPRASTRPKAARRPTHLARVQHHVLGVCASAHVDRDHHGHDPFAQEKISLRTLADCSAMPARSPPAR
jgi:hypothetical protein